MRQSSAPQHGAPRIDTDAARNTPWDLTMPADLPMRPASRPFDEPLRGLSMREVIEPDVFAHFFGTFRLL